MPLFLLPNTYIIAKPSFALPMPAYSFPGLLGCPSGSLYPNDRPLALKPLALPRAP
jgi:hypothetical protein